jgi:ATP synthase subunit 6
MFFAPLEQFEILRYGVVLGPSILGGRDWSITNLTVYCVIFLCLFLYLFKYPVKIIPNYWQIGAEQFLLAFHKILADNAPRGKQFLPYFFSFAYVLACSNLFGMIPLGFTVTSHIIVTFFFSFSVFFFFFYVALKTHGVKFLAFFLPGGTPFTIMPFLVIIELLSWVSRLFSLAIRLFANMMSGHTLLKILISFLFISITSTFPLGTGGTAIYVIDVLPIILLHLIIGMELAIACVQIYVFLVLTALYLNDAISLAH